MKWGRGGARSNNQLPRRSRCCPFACVTSKRPGERAARVTYDVRTRAQQGGFYPQDFLVLRSDVEAPFVPPLLIIPLGNSLLLLQGFLRRILPLRLPWFFPFLFSYLFSGIALRPRRFFGGSFSISGKGRGN